MPANRCIQVWSGGSLDPLDPNPDDVSIRDIAHALSLQCRYNGHTEAFYSVAQHSALTAHFAPRELALTALLHDAAEAYIGDLASPIKNCTDLGALYRDVEENLARVIAEKFGTVHPLPSEVKDADLRMLATEVRDLMRPARDDWLWGRWIENVIPYDEVIVGMPPLGAELTFLEMFRVLGGEL